MSSADQPRAALNLDSAPLGSAAGGAAEPPAPPESDEPDTKASPSTLNVGKRTFVTRSVASNVPKAAERVTRQRSVLPTRPPALSRPVVRPVAISPRRIPRRPDRPHATLAELAPSPSPSGYRTDPDAVAKYGALVAEHVLSGRDPVPFRTEDGTDGLAVAGVGGLLFGVTIPFVLPADLPDSARDALRAALDEAAGPWTLISGARGQGMALISPMLHDTRSTWITVERLLNAISRHGGTSASGVHADVRVALGHGAEPTDAWRTGVSRVTEAFTDVLLRLSANPRATRRTQAMTSRVLAPTQPPGADYLVFDFFDATLDPGVLQAHIKLALALVHVGFSQPDAPLPTPAPPNAVQRICVPDGALQPGAHTVYELDSESGTAAVTELLGRLFRRDADIEQQLALAALNPWPGARAVLTDDGLARAIELLSTLPASDPTAPRHEVVGVADEGALTVFGGIELAIDRFALLLRATGWQPESGLALTFVRRGTPPSPLARAGRTGPMGRRDRLAPPAEAWPRLLGWARDVAGLLGTRVYVAIPANVNLLHVPTDLLDSHQAYGPVEAARLMRDWRTETQTSSIVLRHVPADVTAPDTDGGGDTDVSMHMGRHDLRALSVLSDRPLVPLPREAAGPVALIELLRRALVSSGSAEGSAVVDDQVAAGAARIRYAVNAQIRAQAAINRRYGLDGCSPGERAVLTGDRRRPPVLERWTAPVPLVLVDCLYAPVTQLPRPSAEAPGEIRWLRPATAADLRSSLADLIDFVGLADRDGPGEPDPTDPTPRGV